MITHHPKLIEFAIDHVQVVLGDAKKTIIEKGIAGEHENFPAIYVDGEPYIWGWDLYLGQTGLSRIEAAERFLEELRAARVEFIVRGNT